MRYATISLRDVIEKFGKGEAATVLSTFFCPKNKDVEDFMHYKALPYECAGMACTYLIIASEYDIENKKEISHGICAIYSVTTKSITIDQGMTRKSR